MDKGILSYPLNPYLENVVNYGRTSISTKEIEENFTRVHREIVLDINKTLISLIAERPAQTAPLLKEEDLNPSYV